MRDARVRILLGQGLEMHERKAATDAAETFRKFGLGVETVSGPDERVWRDRCRQQFFELVFGQGVAVVRGESHFYRPLYTVPNDGAMLAGVTAREIRWAESGSVAVRGGFSIDAVGCIVSVAGLRQENGDPYRNGGPSSPSEGAEALRLALVNEMGHALIGKAAFWTRGFRDTAPRFDPQGNCLSGGCILARVDSYLTLLRRLGGAQEAFCQSCSEMLKSRVLMIESLGCA